MAETVGEQLKQARNQRKLTLEQVSQATHIRVGYLEALENDRREDLPSSVQGRGFLRLYAGLLNLPVAPLLATWEGKSAEAELAPAAPTLADSLVVAEKPEPAPKKEILATASGELAVEEPAPEVSPMEAEPEPQPESSRAIFREIGQELRQQRDLLGLTITEVERYTRLRAHYIQALEDGKFEALPSSVQGKGMLTNYVDFLNLDEEKILLRFAEGLQARRIEKLPKPEPESILSPKKKPARQAPVWRRFLTPDLIFGTLVATVILFFALWTAARINNLRTTQTQPTPLGISEILLTPGTLGQNTLTPGVTGSPQAARTLAVTPQATNGTGTVVPVIGIPLAGTPQSTQLTPASSPVGTSTLQPINKDPLQIYIIAHQRAFLRVTADDKVKFLGRVIPGNAYAFSATKRLEFVTGNAAAIQVFYNQNDLGTMGIEGEVVSLVFTAQGIATPTLAFTPTPTATKLATVTPLPSATPKATATITPLVP